MGQMKEATMNKVLLVGTESGLFLTAYSTPSGKIVSCTGKGADVEVLEMNCIRVNSQYYNVVGAMGELLIVEEQV